MAVEEDAPEGGADKGKDKATGGGTSPLVKILIIAAVAIALVTVTAFVSYKVASGIKNPVETTHEPASLEVQSPEPRKIVEVGEIKTVIRGSALKMTISLGFDAKAEANKLLETELIARLPQLRSQYLAILFTMSDAELAPQNIASLKDRLLKATNPLLRNGVVADVFISEYVFMGK